MCIFADTKTNSKETKTSGTLNSFLYNTSAISERVSQQDLDNQNDHVSRALAAISAFDGAYGSLEGCNGCAKWETRTCEEDVIKKVQNARIERFGGLDNLEFLHFLCPSKQSGREIMVVIWLTKWLKRVDMLKNLLFNSTHLEVCLQRVTFESCSCRAEIPRVRLTLCMHLAFSNNLVFNFVGQQPHHSQNLVVGWFMEKAVR